MQHPTNHIFDFTPETLRDWCTQRGMPAFRAPQILEWVYGKGVVDPGAMSNLSKRDRELLSGPEGITFLSGDVLTQQAATDGTQKMLIQWTDPAATDGTAAAAAPPSLPLPPPRGLALPVLGSANAEPPAHGSGHTGLVPDPTRQTECVMIPAEDEDGHVIRRTACISSQVGCPVGCRFCASGQGGLDGNLSAGRIVEQVWRLNELVKKLDGPAAGGAARPGTDSANPKLAARNPRISNVVFMGMGEPLANIGNVMHAVRTIGSLWGMGISARKITISTVGLPAAIRRLASELDLPVTLALSLHAPNDELRRKLIPWAEYTTIAELLDACRAWFEKTGREITLEYTLLRGVNDRREHAEQLAAVARTLRANINLIRYNEVAGLGLPGEGDFKRPRTEDVLAFQNLLRERGLNTHIRRSRGRDIAAACGQLRHEAKGQDDDTGTRASTATGAAS